MQQISLSECKAQFEVPSNAKSKLNASPSLVRGEHLFANQYSNFPLEKLYTHQELNIIPCTLSSPLTEELQLDETMIHWKE